jgi:ribonucleoside-diphosphate reductase alpha chain
MKNQTKPKTKGLNLKRLFTNEQTSPYDQFQYQKRKSGIRNASGQEVFQMEEVEVPAQWSQLATDILAQKYFRRSDVPQKDGSMGPETSVKQVVHRLADCWRHWGESHGYFASKNDAQIFYDEIVYTLLGQYAAPNSPQWFNTGLFQSYGIKGKPQGHYNINPVTGALQQSTSAFERPQVHACFILSVHDDLVNEGGIMDLWVKEARIFKYGSGAGTNFSQIRGKDEKLSAGGYSSGLMSFLRVGDRAAGAIKSGGTTRRAAKMVCLDIDHPEIVDFVNWKVEEEKKVAALKAAGYSADFEGEAYQTVSGQNSNNSVRIPNVFFTALDKNGGWELKNRSDGKVNSKIPAHSLWKAIAYGTWKCGDPGVQFDTTINEWHTCPEAGRINASNPCSEYMFLDNTACNLASLNLWKFWNQEKDVFDTEAFTHVCRLYTIVLEISVLMAQFPSAEIAQRSYDYRTLGLGFANLGGMLMRAGIPYDSQQARAMAGAISALMTGEAYATSAEMAASIGAFNGYEKNKKHMLRVLKNHRAALFQNPDLFEGLDIIPQTLNSRYCPDYLLQTALQTWDKAIDQGEKYGFRNAQVTAIAPTGTIGLLMDCDTTGIEPDFALVKFKKLSGGGYVKIINQAVPAALYRIGYPFDTIKNIEHYITGKGTLKGAPYINPQTLADKGFTKTELQKLEDAIKFAFELDHIFNPCTLGEDCLQRLGISKEEYQKNGFNLLKKLGFNKEEITACNEYVCGHMTIEGAPGLKEEHLPVFDCANKNGKKGVRFLPPHSHIRMMASVQPFISGAISKTINMPHEATVEDIQECYALSWKLGLKSCAIYRDGSKLSQPLSNESSKDEDESPKGTAKKGYTFEELLEATQKAISQSDSKEFKQELSRLIERKKLPARRSGFTQKAKISGQTIFVRTGEYEDGALGEIFIDMYKEGVAFRSMLNCFSIAISIGLQYGVPLEEFVERFVFTRFEPSGFVEHPNIKNTTSVLDYVFRLLAFEYLDRSELVHVPNPEKLKPNPNILTKAKPSQDHHDENKGLDSLLSNVDGDAPACDVCGHITVRSGTCFKCLNCGNSLGCS